jgi:PAS domain S-box-containing protein
MIDQLDAEEALRASEERFRALTEISSDWFWETDSLHRFTFLSLETTLDYKTRRAEILGKTRWELFPESMTPPEWEVHFETLAERRPFQGIVTRTINRETGKATGFYSLSGLPMHDAQGKFIGYRGIGRDITRIKLAEQEMAESEARFRLITQNMRDIIVLMQPDGKTIYLSPSFTRVTGHDIETSLPKDVASFFHPDDFVWLQQDFARCAAGERDGQQLALTYRFHHADGHYIWLEGQMHLVRDEQGLPRHIQISARDVTSRRLAEIAVEAKTQELKEANAALETEIRSRQELERNMLLAIEKELESVGLELHDELGQDLTGIALLTKTLAQKLVEQNLAEASLAGRISELVKRTIGHTRMIAHGLSPYIWGDDGLVAALRQLANDVNSLEAVKCDARIPTAVTISDRVVALTLYRIAQEAVNNALKHSKAGKIRIALTRTSRGIELVVSDNGIGRQFADDDAASQPRLHSIRHRCRAIDATLSIGKGRLGGTMVRVAWRGVPSCKSALQIKRKKGAVL